MTGPRWWIVGGGRIGASLALDLARVAPPVGVIDPAPSDLLIGVEGLAAHTPGSLTAPGSTALQWGPPADEGGPTVVFAVPDDALAEAAAAWAALAADVPALRPRHALHASGLHPASVLAPLSALGAALGSWHPVLAVSRPGPGRFAGRTVTVEGEQAAIEAGERLAALVGASARRISTEAKPRCHATAVFASNYVVACLAAALRLSAADGSEGEAPEPGSGDARRELRDLLDLARSALDGVEAAGLAGGLTGPVARGDADTIRAHLRALDPTTRDLYRALGREAFRLARATLPEADRVRVRASLDSGGDEDGPPEGGSEDGQ